MLRRCSEGVNRSLGPIQDFGRLSPVKQEVEEALQISLGGRGQLNEKGSSAKLLALGVKLGLQSLLDLLDGQ